MVALKDEIREIQAWLEKTKSGCDWVHESVMIFVKKLNKEPAHNTLSEEQRNSLKASIEKLSGVLKKDTDEVKKRIEAAVKTLADFKLDDLGEGVSDAKKESILASAYSAMDKVLTKASGIGVHLEAFLKEESIQSFAKSDGVFENSLQGVEKNFADLVFTKSVAEGHSSSLKRSSAIVTGYLEGVCKHLSDFEKIASEHADSVSAVTTGVAEQDEIEGAVSSFKLRIQKVAEFRESLEKSGKRVKDVISDAKLDSAELQEGIKALKEGVSEKISATVGEIGDLNVYLSEFTKKIQDKIPESERASLKESMDSLAKQIKTLEGAIKQDSTKVCKAFGIEMPSGDNVFQVMWTAIRGFFAMIYAKVSLFIVANLPGMQKKAIEASKNDQVMRDDVMAWCQMAAQWYAAAFEALKGIGQDFLAQQEWTQGAKDAMDALGQESASQDNTVAKAAALEAASGLSEMGEEVGVVGRAGVQKALLDLDEVREAGQTLASTVSEGAELQQQDDSQSQSKAEEVLQSRREGGGHSR
ncbi:MAG: hypothetical protein ACTJLL_04895 [Anaplasma sp.]